MFIMWRSADSLRGRERERDRCWILEKKIGALSGRVHVPSMVLALPGTVGKHAHWISVASAVFGHSAACEHPRRIEPGNGGGGVYKACCFTTVETALEIDGFFKRELAGATKTWLRTCTVPSQLLLCVAFTPFRV